MNGRFAVCVAAARALLFGSLVVSSSYASNVTWFSDALPSGAQPETNNDSWNWISGNPTPYVGTLADQSNLVSGLHEQFFSGATATMSVGANDTLFAYVYINPANAPSEIMVEWYDGSSWEHRAYWGADTITYGNDGTASRQYMGPIPATGQWVELSIPAASVGLGGATVSGMGFSLEGGQAAWDNIGDLTPAASSSSGTGTDSSTGTSTGSGSGTASGSSPSQPAATEVVWYDSALPAGAQPNTNNDSWNWISSNPTPYTGSLADQTNVISGLHEQFFSGATATMSVGTSDTLFAYVYLNPSNPPSEVMVEWYDGSSWEHRAYWGNDTITYGNDGTASRQYMGPLPATGQWVRLNIPAAQVGLGGATVSGLGLSLEDGQATWDPIGDSTASPAGSGSTSPTGSTGTNPSTGSTTGSGSTSSSGSASTGTGTSSSGSTSTDPGTPTSSGSTGSTGTTSSTGTTTTTSGSTTSSTGSTSSTGTTSTTGTSSSSGSTAAANYTDDTDLQLPQVGSSILHILSPNLLELVFINTKQPDPAQVTAWNFVSASGQASDPSPGEFNVTVNGQTVAVTSVGFKRRVLYAPLIGYDLRIQNSLYLQLATPVSDGQPVTVINPDTTLWTAGTEFSATADPQRYSPAIHVNQEGYAPEFPEQAMVGYFLGDLGEMPINAGGGFNLINASTGAVVYTGQLTQRSDSGYETTPVPYQQVYVADFSGYTTPGEYQIQVPGMGASLPFSINDGIAMAWARTYALGMYEQRSGMAVSMPYTRFTHAADHTAPASVPVPDSNPQFSFTWSCIAGYATTVNTANPPQAAPFLTNNEDSLYPYVNTGTVDVSGGHFDAGDYSKYTINSAQLVHELIFAVDNIPGCQQFDNLGIPESGDNIPDALQEAKWEADFLAKMQDADGGFYFLVYPLNREYESNVLPENGDPQVVWPKNTTVSAAATAALAEAASSPAMLKYYPQAAANYLQKAQLGWQFLMNAYNKYGMAGAYQKLTFYGDDWAGNDNWAWAAASLFAATGNAQYQTQLFNWFPNPADSSTFRWGWWQMSEGWGNAIRDYAFAAKSGRLPAADLDPSYLAACDGQVVAAGDDAVTWGNDCAYGTPFPPETKAVLGGGWYFSLDQASDMAVAYQIDPKPAYVTGLVAAMNYEGGNNPVNTCYIEGLGLKRQHQVVSQYFQNSRRQLAPSGFVVGEVTAAYEYLNQYGSELSELSYPTDNGSNNCYPYYDRWADAYNVTDEQITVNLARSFLATGFLASLTQSASTAWTAPQATINAPTSVVPVGSPLTLSVQVAGQDLSSARIVWEGRDQQAAFGSTYTVTPVNNGDQWVEAEVEWPDGRRAFAEADYTADSQTVNWIDGSLPSSSTTNSDGGDGWNWISSNPTPDFAPLDHQSNLASGLHEHYFTTQPQDVNATNGLVIGAGDTLFAWVYINPSNPPTEVMLGWYDGSGWEHRAYWGADTITYGADGTAGRYNAGPLPAAGQWVELSVPASAVGLEGITVSGIDFSLYGGQATWDTAGKTGPLIGVQPAQKPD